MFSHNETTNESIHRLFDAVDAISVQGYDQQRRVIYWNIGSELLYGFTREEALGKTLESLIIPEPMQDFVVAAHSDWVKNDIEIPASELTLQNKNKEDVSVFSSHVMFTNQHAEREMYCIDISLAEVKDAQAQAVFKENMLAAVFEATPDMFFLLTEDGTIIDYHANDISSNLKISPEKFIGRPIASILPARIARKFKKHCNSVMDNGKVSSFEYELSTSNDSLYFEARISHLKIEKRIVAIVRDITEQYKSAEIIRQQAYYDTLTGLLNRFLSLKRLSQVLSDAKNYRYEAAVLFLDLDNFKKVNDSLGHEVGDKLLIEAAKRLSSALCEKSTVGRLGGDEFIVLLPNLNSKEETLKVTENLLSVFRDPFHIDARDLVLTLSIGVAIYPENGDSVSTLLRNADTAMYQAKSIGRNAYSRF